jgi:hypothetical protein
VLAGLLIGIMLYKPQFALGLIVLFLLQKRWISAATAVAVGGAFWAWSAVLMGLNWMSIWWPRAVEVSVIDAKANGSNPVSFVGALGHAGGCAGKLIGWGLSGLLALALAILWRNRRDLDPAAFYGLAGAASVFVLPRPLFYEAGLAPFVAAFAATGAVRAGSQSERWRCGSSRSQAPSVLCL